MSRASKPFSLTSRAFSLERRGARSRRQSFKLQSREIAREACEDAAGNRYVVIVWQAHPSLFRIRYCLDDGRAVKLVDDRVFEIADTGTFLTRCA